MSFSELTIPGGNKISQWLFAVQVVQGNCTAERLLRAEGCAGAWETGFSSIGTTVAERITAVDLREWALWCAPVFSEYEVLNH